MKTIPIELLTFRDIYTTYQEGKEKIKKKKESLRDVY